MGSTLSHPNLVRIYDYSIGDASNPAFLVMEYVDGTNLGSWIEMFHPIPAKLIARIVLQLLDALEALHGADLIHRDVKPVNIMVSTSFDIKLMDLGVVRVTKDNPLTPEDKFLGTIRNSSPELLLGQKYDYTTDVYSLGTVLYALVHGQEVFADEKQFARLIQRISTMTPEVDDAAAVREDGIATLQAITRRLLARSPGVRPGLAEIRAELKPLESSNDPYEPLHGYIATALTGLESARADAVAFVSSRIAEVAKQYNLFVYQPRRATDPVLHATIEPSVVHLLDRRRVASSDVLILLANEPSFGAGQEMEIASGYNKPTILIARKGTRISRMLLGSFANILGTIYYETPEDLEAQLRLALRGNLDVIRKARRMTRRVAGLQIGGRLKELREAAGYASVDQLSQAIGMSPRILDHLESGDIDNPGVRLLAYVARGLNSSIADLLSEAKVAPIGAPQDQNLQSLEKVARRLNWSAVDLLDLRDDYLRQIAAQGESQRLSDEQWSQRHYALETRRLQSERRNGDDQASLF